MDEVAAMGGVVTALFVVFGVAGAGGWLVRRVLGRRRLSKYEKKRNRAARYGVSHLPWM